MSAYTDADVRDAEVAIGLGGIDTNCTLCTRQCACPEHAARTALAAVAPAIAARALREAADAFAKASPASAFVAGWTAAEMGLRARAVNFYERP